MQQAPGIRNPVPPPRSNSWRVSSFSMVVLRHIAPGCWRSTLPSFLLLLLLNSAFNKPDGWFLQQRSDDRIPQTLCRHIPLIMSPSRKCLVVCKTTSIVAVPTPSGHSSRIAFLLSKLSVSSKTFAPWSLIFHGPRPSAFFSRFPLTSLVSRTIPFRRSSPVPSEREIFEGFLSTHWSTRKKKRREHHESHLSYRLSGDHSFGPKACQCISHSRASVLA